MGSLRNLLDRYVTEVWEARHPDAAEGFLAPGYRRHRSATGETIDRAGQLALLGTFHRVFPDATITIEDSIEEGNRIAFRSTMRGTHRDTFLGIPPTGRKVTVGLLDLIRVEDGLFVEQWGGPDMLDLIRQLGGTVTSA
jgi:predicted ester cyclase